MGLSVRVVGRARKRGLIPRLPTGERLAADIESWLKVAYADVLASIRCASTRDGDVELRFGLHPAASEVVLTADDIGGVVAQAATSAVGPGYHTYVCQLLHRLGDELLIAWGDGDGEGALVDDTGYFGSGDRRAAERAQLGWLRDWLGRAREARRLGAAGLHLGTPAGVRYSFDGAVATVLGPRDDAWLESAIEDARVAVDVWPWWADVTDANYMLRRALCMMWSDVRWRPPTSDADRQTVDAVLHLLRRAYPLDPSLLYPWREWKELLDLHAAAGWRDSSGSQAGSGPERPSDSMAAMVAERAQRSDDDGRAPIGYRRRPLTVIHRGWALEIPGSFDERRSDDEWWGGEAGRAMALAAVDTGTLDGPMSAEAFLRQVAGHLGDDVLDHRSGAVVGKAHLGIDGTSGVAVGVLEGYSAVSGSGAAIRIEFGDPEDWAWAVERWKALRPFEGGAPLLS